MFPFRKTLIILVVLQVSSAIIPIIPRPPVSELCAAKPPKVDNTGRQKPIGNIECGEVVAYLRALSRYHGRRCLKKDSKCRDRDTYPSRWFDKVGTKITSMCQRLEMYERGEKPVGAPAWEKSTGVGKDGGRCKTRNSIL